MDNDINKIKVLLGVAFMSASFGFSICKVVDIYSEEPVEFNLSEGATVVACAQGKSRIVIAQEEDGSTTVLSSSAWSDITDERKLKPGFTWDNTKLYLLRHCPNLLAK